jgi:radical SAM superfamily enzyme YgiQ (UPF0313 family)
MTKPAQIDILLIKPGSQKQLYGELSSYKLTAIEPPLWGALTAAFLRDRGFSVALLDAEVEGLSYRGTAERINATAPLLTVIVVSGTNPSASTMNMTGVREILREARDLQAPGKTMVMGLHPSALPERTMTEETVDFVCQGEGFFTLPPLLEDLKNQTDDVSGIPGLWHRQDGHVIGNPRPVPLEDLSTLPMPAWDLLPMKQYRAHNWHCFDAIHRREPYAVLYTSLGCPFRCSFCCINALFGKSMIRYRPIPAVVEEIDFLVTRYGVRNIKIMDEMFALNENRVAELCDAIISRGYDLNFWAYARVNTVTPRMLEKMKKAGINWLAYGFESGSKRVLEDAVKAYHLEEVRKVVEMTYAQDIHICANYIFGLPEDDFESMNDTLKLMLDLNAEWSNIYSAMAFPGSPLYEMALAENWPLPETWQGYSQYAYDCLPLPTRYLSGGQVLAFRDFAFDVNAKNPRYLHKIARKFGVGTAEHVQEMAAKTLPRKHAIPFQAA